MTLGEILTMISRKFPNSLETSEVVTLVNVVQAEIFRNFCKEMTTREYTLIPGIQYYEIPFSKSKISEILVNGVSYPFKNIKDNGLERFAYFLDNYVGIRPKPTEQGEMLIFHEREPAVLTDTQINSSPDLDKDFHMLLVYGVCVHLAEEALRPDMVNAFTEKYNGLLEDFKNATDEPEYHVIQDAWGVLN